MANVENNSRVHYEVVKEDGSYMVRRVTVEDLAVFGEAHKALLWMDEKAQSEGRRWKFLEVG